MVCRLVQKQKLSVFHKNLGKRNLLCHTARKLPHLARKIINAKHTKHRLNLLAVVPKATLFHLKIQLVKFCLKRIRCTAFHLGTNLIVLADNIQLWRRRLKNVGFNRIVRIKKRILRQKRKPGFLINHHRTFIRHKQPRNRIQQSGLTRTVATNQGSLVALVQAKSNPSKKRLFPPNF